MPNQVTILAHTTLQGNYRQVRVHAAWIASVTQPGHFYSAKGGYRLLVMRVDTQSDSVEFLYHAEGAQSCALAELEPNSRLDLEGPFGDTLSVAKGGKILLIGEKLGLAPLVFFCQSLLALHPSTHPLLVLLGDDGTFPFTAKPSQFIVDHVPAGVIACMPLMEDWKIASRLANQQSLAGCYEGSVVELAQAWLENQHNYRQEKIDVYASGSKAMGERVSVLAQRFDFASLQILTLD